MSTDPSRWRVCETHDGHGGALINLSDEVEVFAGAPQGQLAAYESSDENAQVREALNTLTQDVTNDPTIDPAVPLGVRFAYVQPGGRVEFSGSPGIMLNVKAGRSLIATTEAGAVRTVYKAAIAARGDGRVAQMSPLDFLLSLKNFVSQCAKDARQFVSSQGNLEVVVTSALKGAPACKKTISLFTPNSAEKGALERETETTLQWRFKTLGRNALADRGLWEDAGKLLLTSLEHAR